MLKSFLNLLGVSKNKGIANIRELNKKLTGSSFMDGKLDPATANYLVLDSTEKLLAANLVQTLRQQGDTVLVIDQDAALMKLVGVSQEDDMDLIVNLKDKRCLAWNPLVTIQSEWDVPRIVKMVVHHLNIADYQVSGLTEELLKKVVLYCFKEEISLEARWATLYTLLFKSPTNVLEQILNTTESDPILQNLDKIRSALYVLDDYGMFATDKDLVFIEEAISYKFNGVIYFPLHGRDESQEFFMKIAVDSLLYAISNNKKESEHKFWLLVSSNGKAFDFLNLSDCVKSAKSISFGLIEVQVDAAERAPHLAHSDVEEVLIAQTNISLAYVNEDTSRTLLDPNKVKQEVAGLKPIEYFRLYQTVLYKGQITPLNSTGFKKLLAKDLFGIKLPKLEQFLITKEKPAVTGRSVPAGYVEPAKATAYTPPSRSEVELSSETAEEPTPSAVVPRTRFEIPSSKRAKQQAFSKQAANSVGIH